jgi:hypothetical protein
VVRPWCTLHGDRRVRFLHHTSADRVAFERHARREGLTPASVGALPLPFCVTVSAGDVAEHRRLSVADALSSGALRPRGWSADDFETVVGVHPAHAALTGSVLLGSRRPSDLDVLVDQRPALERLRRLAVRDDARREALISAQQAYYVDVDPDAHAALARRTDWRRLRLGGSALDVTARSGPGARPALELVSEGTAVRTTLGVEDATHSDFFPALYGCRDGVVLIAWSRLLQSALAPGDELVVEGRASRWLIDGVATDALFVTDADPILWIDPSGSAA